MNIMQEKNVNNDENLENFLQIVRKNYKFPEQTENRMNLIIKKMNKKITQTSLIIALVDREFKKLFPNQFKEPEL